MVKSTQSIVIAQVGNAQFFYTFQLNVSTFYIFFL